MGLPGGSRGNTSVIRTPVTNVGLKSRQCEQSNSVVRGVNSILHVALFQ